MSGLKPQLSPEEAQKQLEELVEKMERYPLLGVTPMIVFVTLYQKVAMQQLSMDLSGVIQTWLPEDIKRWQIAKDERLLARMSRTRKAGKKPVCKTEGDLFT